METLGSPSNTEIVKLAAAGGATLLDSQLQMLEKLELGDSLEHILITLQQRLCLICPVDSARFVYVIVDRAKGNPVMAQRVTKKALQELESECPTKPQRHKNLTALLASG